MTTTAGCLPTSLPNSRARQREPLRQRSGTERRERTVGSLPFRLRLRSPFARDKPQRRLRSPFAREGGRGDASAASASTWAATPMRRGHSRITIQRFRLMVPVPHEPHRNPRTAKTQRQDQTTPQPVVASAAKQPRTLLHHTQPANKPQRRLRSPFAREGGRGDASAASATTCRTHHASANIRASPSVASG